MALYTPGPMIGQASGRVGGTIFSRNRGGSYVRNGSLPSRVTSEKALNAKAYLSLASQAWSALTAAQRLSWNTWAASKTVVNRLGRSISLNGQNWYVSLNTRLLAAGSAQISAPPTDTAPAGVTITGFTVDAGTGDTELTFSPTPTAAGNALWVRGCMVNSGAVTNVENLFTTLDITAAAVASPLDLKSALEAALGPILVGATYHVEVRVLDLSTGMVSGRVLARTVAVSTP